MQPNPGMVSNKYKMTWTNKYKKSIDCNNPKGFSQKAHCRARKLRQMGKKTESKPITETIRHEGNKWNIYSKDGSKRLGSYDTETAAKKRLQQIEYFKHMNESRVDKHEISGKVIIDGHVFSDAGKSGRSTYGRYSVKDPNYVKDPKEVGMHRNYRKPSSLNFSTLADAKKWVKTQPKKSPEEIDRIHKKHAEFEKYMNEEVPVNNVGGGQVAGLGVGDQGEPGVKKKKKEIIPFRMFKRK